MSYLTVLLDSKHDRKSFSCGNTSLDNYLKKVVNQDIRRKLSVCFILPNSIDNNVIQGFYTLSSDNISLEDLPLELKSKMPKSYDKLPASLIGRLAVDIRFKGKGIGELLLLDALSRCFNISENSMGSMAVVVDPIDENAKNFYTKYGFILLPDSGRLFLPMKTISDLFKKF